MTSDDSDGGFGFIDFGDVPLLDCDPGLQDCPEGSKCNIYIDPDLGLWKGATCVPLVEDPVPPGGPCWVEDHFGSGFDNCSVGAMCSYVYPDTLEGTCVGLCQGPNVPYQGTTCEQAGTSCRADPQPATNGPAHLCLPECDPLVQPCPEGQGCYKLGAGGWYCEPNLDGGTGMTSDECGVDTDCAPGYQCTGQGTLTSCNHDGCCTMICAVGDDAACPNYPLEACNPLKLGGEIGQCGMPPDSRTTSN